MKSNLKAILSAVGIAALLASPAAAKLPARRHNAVHHHAAPPRSYVPSAYGYMLPNQYPITNWCATHPYSWDACHDPRENPQN
jgi:hypothetical protein